MSEEKKKLTPDRTYLCRTVILEEKDTGIHAAPPKPVTDHKGKDEIDDDIIINAFSKFFDESIISSASFTAGFERGT